MDSLERDMAAMRDGLLPEWDAERSARVYAGVGQLRRRRSVHRAGMIGAGLVAVAVTAVVALPRSRAPELARAPVPARLVAARVVPGPAPAVTARTPALVAEENRTLRLADGSTVEMFGAATDVRIVRDESTRVDLALVVGRVRFDVVPRPARNFEIAAGAWRIMVVGTRFEIERAGGRVRVSVERGRVRVARVDGTGGERDLTVGETAWFDESARERASARPVTVNGREDASLGWRSLIQTGDHDGAYRLLQAGARVDDDPWALMDAADAARLSGHPDGAVDYLDRVVRDHGQSPVAPLAAFTLGRIDLDRLGRPHDAAQAFASARALAPDGSLAQDALAREVEAWSKAGDAQKAYERAQEYVGAYPDGRRITAVKRYGGLEKIE